MTTTATTALGTRGHYITLDHHGNIDREELTATVETYYRGRSLFVDFETSRYRHSSGISEWRIIPRGARTVAGDAVNLSPGLVERLHTTAVPTIAGWLTGNDYALSRGRAIAREWRRQLGNRFPSLTRLRADHAWEVAPDDLDYLARLADAMRAAHDLYDEGLPSDDA